MEELVKSTLIDFPRAGSGGQLPVRTVRIPFLFQGAQIAATYLK